MITACIKLQPADGGIEVIDCAGPLPYCRRVAHFSRQFAAQALALARAMARSHGVAVQGAACAGGLDTDPTAKEPPMPPIDSTDDAAFRRGYDLACEAVAEGRDASDHAPADPDEAAGFAAGIAEMQPVREAWEALCQEHWDSAPLLDAGP